MLRNTTMTSFNTTWNFWHSDGKQGTYVTQHKRWVEFESIPCRTNSLTDWLFFTKKRNIHFPSYPTHHHVSRYNIISFLVLSYCLEQTYFSRCWCTLRNFLVDFCRCIKWITGVCVRVDICYLKLLVLVGANYLNDFSDFSPGLLWSSIFVILNNIPFPNILWPKTMLYCDGLTF